MNEHHDSAEHASPLTGGVILLVVIALILAVSRLIGLI
jgi:hypothetical protein